MRRDAIFYKLFQQAPNLLFELLEAVPETAYSVMQTRRERYRFESVVVKEPTFMIDGVFLPPEEQPPGVVFFAEVQMQPDQGLYERMFAESMAYFYRNREAFSDWQAVVIYPSRSTEQSKIYPHRSLLNGGQVHRIYLNELGEIDALPLGVAAMVLTIVEETEAPDIAKMLLQRANQEIIDLSEKQAIIEMVSTIIAYMFTTLSRQEIDDMLGTKMEDVRVFREAKEEGAIGEARSLLLRQLTRKVGSINDRTLDLINSLSIEQLESLGEALLDFGSIDDLSNWLENQN
ncbi:Rpn family recombination-promoting nuclease/putative transposase [Alkalinema sp. FACHB-956]|uniref:Rpn family recombination-promoting nuclease/putative transposase n=1 Tax=Alkalinema sp. FACHB-956 TaxID=2692768 RepID=UPI001688256F|nr:Rpn family recombination-promoting nuclease/putative transposase [Alkalinema sp. FACHB-956]MBD2328182.1 Rpn family recombination-promoting nuclease/putative transposase [Alkalinema sp. FACHB-956]